MQRALDRLLLPLRLARARMRQEFVDEHDLRSRLQVAAYDTGFPEGEAAYNALGVAHDGSIVFAVSTKVLGTGARLFRFDPSAERLEVVTDLDRALGNADIPTIPHGKVHVDFAPVGHDLLAATHLGYYDPSAAEERPGRASGYEPYPGGSVFRLRDGEVTALARAPGGEGVIAMSVDAERGRVFAFTWPLGHLLTLRTDGSDLRDHGAVFGLAETGSKKARTWQRVCRSIAVDLATGHAFWSDERGTVFRFDCGRIEHVAQIPAREMWRKVVFHPGRRVFYGVTWNSGIVFEFDPATAQWREVDRLRPRATLALALRGDELHALAPGPGLLRRDRRQLASTVSHVVIDLASSARHESGPMRLPDGRYVTEAQSLVRAAGRWWTLAWVEVPEDDDSPRARSVRAARSASRTYASRGYAEEIALVSFAG